MERTIRDHGQSAEAAPDKPVFKVGDRGIYHVNLWGNGDLNGLVGTVIYVDDTRCPYTVEFDGFYDVANAVTDYRARKHGIEPRQYHGWFCRPENLTKLED